MTRININPFQPTDTVYASAADDFLIRREKRKKCSPFAIMFPTLFNNLTFTNRNFVNFCIYAFSKWTDVEFSNVDGKG